MKKNVISITEPVNTSSNYWWNGVTFSGAVSCGKSGMEG